MKKKVFLMGMFSIVLTFALMVMGCSGHPVLVDVDSLAEGLAALPDDSTPENPTPIKLKAANITDRWDDINDAVEDSKKYVILDLSNCITEENKIAVDDVDRDNVYDITGAVIIDRGIIYYNKYIKGIIFPSSLQVIGAYAFSKCYNLTNITISDRVTSIEDFAFDRCSLTSVIIPSGVTSIGADAFQCDGLTSVTFEGSGVNISKRTFGVFSNLPLLYKDEGAGTYTRTAGKNDWVKQ